MTGSLATVDETRLRRGGRFITYSRKHDHGVLTIDLPN